MLESWVRRHMQHALDGPVLFPKPSKVEYGTSTTSRRLDASVCKPDPQTIPTRGLSRCAGRRVARTSSVEEKGCDSEDMFQDVVSLVENCERDGAGIESSLSERIAANL